MVLDRILTKALDDNSDGVLLSSRGTRKRGPYEKRLTDIDYADDIALFSDTKSGLKQYDRQCSHRSQQSKSTASHWCNEDSLTNVRKINKEQ